MPDRETNLTNAFETTLVSEMSSVAGSMSLTDATGLAHPFYIVIEPDSVTQREYVYVSNLSGTTATVAERYLAGSAAPSGLTHPAGSVVRMAAMSQLFEDLNDRITALGVIVADQGDHGGLSGLNDDDHGNYLNVARHDLTTRHLFGTSIASAMPTVSAVTDSGSQGTATSGSRSDHRHQREGFGTPGDSAPGDVAAIGVANTVSRSDHKHGRESGGTGGEFVRVERTTEQSLAIGVAATWTVELADTDGFWTAGQPTRLTVPAGLGGTYLVLAGASIAQTGTDPAAQLIATRNIGGIGGSIRGPRINEMGIVGHALTGVMVLVPGDFLELSYDAEGFGNTNFGRVGSYFSMVRLIAA